MHIMFLYLVNFNILIYGMYSYASDHQKTVIDKIEISDIFVDDFTNPSSGKTINKSRIESTQAQDILRVLKDAPGVYAREEDGLGLRPNIGLRGTNPDRSKKVVILEDDILIGPAPYSAPAAYYSPSLLTTETLEIFKGFSSLPYGPNSIGGAINYKTKSFHENDFSRVKLNSGSFNQSTLQTEFQKTINLSRYHLQLVRHQTDSFKQIDTQQSLNNESNILTFKYQRPYQIAAWPNVFEIKASYSTEKSDETYLGLTLSDFEKSPFRRYSASQLDEMKWQHIKLQIENISYNGDSLNLKNQIYHHTFNRKWYRLDGFRDSSKKIYDILKNPSGTHIDFYNLLTGQIDSNQIGDGIGSQLNIASNDRRYISQGFQSQLDYRNALSENIQSHFKTKFLLHNDSIERIHDADYYEVIGLNLNRTNSESIVTARNKDSAQATSLTIIENLKYQSWQLNLLSRYEIVHFAFEDKINNKYLNRSDDVLIPGIGISYDYTSELKLKLSVNRAATLSGLDTSGKENREESVNYEAGVQWQSDKHKQQFETVIFQNNYSNLTGTCTASAGCTNNQTEQQFNGGQALIQGIESRWAQGWFIQKHWIPIQLNFTLLKTQFMNSFNSNSQEWGIGEVNSGDPLPYIPSIMFNAVLGIEKGVYKNSLTINYQSNSYDQSVNTGRITIPAFGLIDYNLNYQFTNSTTLFFKVDNILNRKYIASFKPFGYRPGKPQTFSLGVQVQF